jgi:hypothetical protein
MNCRQWVVDVYRGADALTLNGGFQFPVSDFQVRSQETRNSKLKSVFLGYRTRQIHHSQQDENIRLQKRHSDMERKK